MINLLNLLGADWGLVRLPNTALGQTPGPPSASQPIFRFDPAFKPYDTQSADSYYQLQFPVRYSF